jgi:hypothetical protein
MKLRCLETSGTKYPGTHSYTQEELYFKQVFVVFMLIKINRPISNILNTLYCFTNLVRIYDLSWISWECYLLAKKSLKHNEMENT